MEHRVRPTWNLALAVVMVAALLVSACATSRYGRTYGDPRAPLFPADAAAQRPGPPAARGSGEAPRPGYVKDNRPSIWISEHPRVRRFYEHYSRTPTVEKALERAQRYLPAIHREFRARGLPLELAYLPMLESMFENDADSGRARGLWQFTAQTAEHMGLRVGAFVDERLNWQKATRAAAAYLDQLGAQFNYNWGLALAAYNGGPAYIERAMRGQHSWNYFDLRLRSETQQYVPRFVAMVQVAKEKYPHLLMAGR